MAGKRPDQHNIAPGEAGASDYKNLPQNGHGGSMEEMVEDDRQNLSAQRGMGAGGGAGQHFFDPNHPQPSQHANAGRPVENTDDQGGRSDEEQRELRGTEDPRERGVGA